MKNIFLAIILLLTYNIVHAHTCDSQKVKCPIDKTTVKFCVSRSMTTNGTYYDFQKQGAIGNHYEELINSCPKCHYSGYFSDFDTTFTDERTKEIKNFLSKYDTLKIDNPIECLIAGEIKEFLKAKNAEISNCYLIGSYLLKTDSNRIKLRIDLQVRTKNLLILAIDNNEYKDSSTIATINYLIAEMYRRIGDFANSIIYFDSAISDPNKMDWVEGIAIKQKEMAIEKDDDNGI